MSAWKLSMPKPWISNTRSMRIDPPTTVQITLPSVDTIGMTELRNACRHTACRNDTPFDTAVRT